MIPDIPIVFTSGLPRSGSTLLQNLLAQSPFHHATATNDLIDAVVSVRDKWMMFMGFQAQGLELIEPRMLGFLREAVRGFYFDEFRDGKTVFDKSRGHLANIELWEKVLGRKVKLVVPVRDVRDIIASFEKLHRKSVFTDHASPNVEDMLRRLTVRGRAERMLAAGSPVGYALHSLRDVFDRGLSDRLVIVPYRDLTHRTQATIDRVCAFCNLPTFRVDVARVRQVTRENDTVYGMDLHTVRERVEPDAGASWKGVLPDDLAEMIDQQYASIQSLANGRA